MGLDRVNFHPPHRKPVFLQEPYNAMMRTCVAVVREAWGILCAAWDVIDTLLVTVQIVRPTSVAYENPQ